MNLNINDFSGPLDLLLFMVKKREIDIYEIDIKIIIDEYITFINSLDKNDLDNKSEYLIMASELIHLKSKLLLGLDEEEPNENYEIVSEDQLRDKILEYERYKNINENFKILEANRQDFFTKLPESLKEYNTKETIIEEMDVDLLVEAILAITQRQEIIKPKTTKIARKELNINDKITYIKNILKENEKIEFTSLFQDYSKNELIITLLSVLEMSKNKEVVLSQSKNFSKIFIEVRHE